MTNTTLQPGAAGRAFFYAQRIGKKARGNAKKGQDREINEGCEGAGVEIANMSGHAQPFLPQFLQHNEFYRKQLDNITSQTKRLDTEYWILDTGYWILDTECGHSA